MNFLIKKNLRDKKYLKWLSAQPPHIPGWGDTVYHHVKLFCNGGVGIKPPDNDCLPVAFSVHDEIHQYGEKEILINRHGYSVELLRDICDTYYRIYKRTLRNS